MTTQQAKEGLRKIETAEKLLIGLTQKQKVDLCLYAVCYFYKNVTVQTDNTQKIKLLIDRIDALNCKSQNRAKYKSIVLESAEVVKKIKKSATDQTTIIYKIAQLAYDMSIAATSSSDATSTKYAQYVIYYALKFSGNKIIDDLAKIKEFLITEEIIQN